LTETASAQEPPANQGLDADAFYNRAANLYANGLKANALDQRIQFITRAGEIFEQYLQQFPRGKDVQAAEYYYAMSFYHSGRIDDAKRIFASIIRNQRNGPYLAAACYSMATDAFEKKDYATAAVLYAKLSANAAEPKDRFHGFYYEALCHHYRGRDKDALACYFKGLNDPDSAKNPYLHVCRQAVGMMLLNGGQAKEALTYFLEVIASPAQEKYRAEATLYAGIASLKLEDQPAAEKYFQDILANNAEEWRLLHADALTSMMQLRFNDKKYAEVIQIYRSNPLNTGDERQARRANVAARSHMLLGQFMDAIPLFLEVQKLAPKSDLAFDASYNRLLSFYKVDGQHIVEQADAFIEMYGKTKKNHPRIHAALMFKAGALAQAGKDQEAADTYNLIDPTLISEATRANLLFHRAHALSKVADHQGAIRSLSKFLEDYTTDRRSPEALILRADAYLESGDRDAAIKDYATLLQSNPGPQLSAHAWQKTAVAKKRNNDFPGMVKAYQTLLANYKDLPDATIANAEFFIGYGLQKQKDYKNAIIHLLKARELNAKTYGRQAGLSLIDCYFSLEQIEPLCAEIDNAIDNGYSEKLSQELVAWAAMQSLSSGQAERAARFFMMISTPDEPRRTPRHIWRNLAKAQILIKDFKGALQSVGNVLTIEDKPVAKTDAFLDQARCHLALKDLDKAQKSIEECLLLKPQGPLEVEARIVQSDIFMEQGKPENAKEALAANALFVEDSRLKPMLLSRMIKVLQANNEAGLAEKYQKELNEKFPNWKE
jgi:tetratricopeptide (TPR) repeat protein